MPAPIVDQAPTNQSIPTPPKRRRGLALLTAGALVVLAGAVGVSVALATKPTPAASPAAQGDTATVVTSDQPGTPAAQPAGNAQQPADRSGAGKADRSGGTDDRASGGDAGQPAALPDGKHSAYITKLDAARGTVVVDVVQEFTDRRAVEEAIRDGESRDTAKYRTVYLRNENPRLRTLPLAGDVQVHLRECEAPKLSRDQLLAKLASNARSGTYYYTLTVDRGVVRRIDEKIAGNAC
jgi:hypothetical protein